MEKKLRRLFDFQKFEQNEHLRKLISETEARQAAELSDDELELVTAAGDFFAPDEYTAFVDSDDYVEKKTYDE